MHPTVHLLIDMVNPLDFEGAEDLQPHALAAARRIAVFKQRLDAAGIPTVYVNDNFGHWELGFRELMESLRSSHAPGAQLLDFIAPNADDHFILKPKHSGFYATSLEVLLALWGARRLILTGVAGNICVMFTANDAHMRGFRLIVPADCTASESEALNEWALFQMRQVMRADTRPADRVSLRDSRTSEQHQDEDHEQHRPERAAGRIAPFTAVRPGRDRTDQSENQNDQ